MTTKTKKTVPSTPSTSPTSSASSTGVSNAGLALLVSEVSAFLDKAEPRLGEPQALTTEDKRRAAKPRKGAEKLLVQLAPIVQQQGLDSTTLSSATMMARLKDAQTLQPLQTRLQKISKRVDDELFSAQGDAWGMGLQFYSLLRNRAKTDGGVAQAIAPMTGAFAFRHPSTKATKPTKVQTRVKANLKKAVALATRHEVTVPASAPVAAAGAVAGAGASAPVVQAAPLMAPQVAAPVAQPVVAPAGAPVAAATPAPVTPPATATAPVAVTPAPAAPAAPANGG